MSAIKKAYINELRRECYLRGMWDIEVKDISRNEKEARVSIHTGGRTFQPNGHVLASIPDENYARSIAHNEVEAIDDHKEYEVI